jgi:hypothetical protein
MPMFVSMPEFQFPVPEPLAVPGAFYARAMAWSTSAAWFVLNLQSSSPQGAHDTLLLAWDTDVADVIRSSDAELESLFFVAPQRFGRRCGWFTKQIVEVWEAIDPSEADSRCILMVADDGQEHSGFFMERAAGLKRTRLVARTLPRAGKGKLHA